MSEHQQHTGGFAVYLHCYSVHLCLYSCYSFWQAAILFASKLNRNHVTSTEVYKTQNEPTLQLMERDS